MTISKLCQECIQRIKCPGKSEVVAGRLPCRHYELDLQLISDQDIIPDTPPPSLKDRPKPKTVKPLVPDAVLIVNKTKADNFKRLATKRLIVVLDGIRKLKNLARRGSYEWEAFQVQMIACHISGAVNDLKKKFQK